MNLKISKEIKLALLGIVAIALFIFGFKYLKGSDIFSSSKTITALYDDVSGLTPSSYVQIQGMNVGSVKTIQLSKSKPGKIEVIMDVNETIEIPVDSKAKIVAMDLLGTKAISISKGVSNTMLQNNQSLASDFELSAIDKLSASAGPALQSITSSAVPAIDNANRTITSIHSTVDNVNGILDAQLKQDLKTSMANMSVTMHEFKLMAQELNKQQAKIASILANVNGFTNNLQGNNATINKLISNTEATTANFKKVDFESSMNELKKTMDNLQVTINKMNNGTGTMALLMNDDKLYKNLKNTLATANNLIYDINARPSRYIHVSVFGKKNKNEAPSQPAPNSND